MRIAYVVGEFPRISETFIVDQIAAVSARGHEVTIFAERPAPPSRAANDTAERLGRIQDIRFQPERPRRRAACAFRFLGLLGRGVSRRPRAAIRAVNVFRYGRSALSGRLLFSASPWLETGGFDVVHCHFGPNGLMAARLREIGLCPAPIVTSFHGYDVNVIPRVRPRDYYRLLFRLGARFAIGSEFMRSRLIALGAPPERVVKLPAGVKLERFAFRERTLLPGDDIRILTVARLVEAKGIDIALRAIHRLRGRFPRIRYEIVDDGPLKDAWTGLSRDLGLIERVRWHGALSHDRLREVYAAAHMFILPSRVARDGAEEGQGLVLAEAQATGLPVVAARIGGIPESIVADESGLLVEESDDAAFAQAIAGLLEHPEEWPRMGHKGREHVERHFSQDNLTDRLLSLYEEVARAGRSAPAKLG